MKTINGKKVYSPSEINYFAKETLEQLIVWVEGEVSQLKKNPNWSFYYLDLKDDKATLPAIASGYLIENLGVNIINKKVIAFGNLSLYEPTGKFQLRIQKIDLSGEGDLYKRLEDLINKLKNEGLFETHKKKQLPQYPRKICLVTSSGSDAYFDFVTHTVEKFPVLELYLADIRVQGPFSVSDILKTLPVVDRKNFDVVVITRGGGSIEDLAAYNSEDVARAIYKMKTPTVVAIGHETNESLAEWVADLRASTPTDAAHIVTKSWQNILEKLDYSKEKLTAKYEKLLDFNLQKLDHLYTKLVQTKVALREYPHRLLRLKEALKLYDKVLIADAFERVNMLQISLSKNSLSFVKKYTKHLDDINHALSILSPQKTLERGYSIVTDKNGKIITDVKSIVLADIIGVKLFHGSLQARVKSKIND